MSSPTEHVSRMAPQNAQSQNANNGSAVAEKEADLAQLLAIHNADLRELLGHRNATIEAEKRSMARELHDTLGSSLTALNMYLALLQHEMPDNPALLKRLDQMKTMLLSITAATRRLQGQLRPEKLDVFGLKVALHEHALEFGKRTGIACRTSLPDEDLNFPSSYDIALFRIAEEALENTARHAHASKVDLILDESEDGVMLTIRDNGCGITPAQPGELHTHGLRAMREHANYLGGRIEIGQGQDGQGTAVTVWLPAHIIDAALHA